MCCAEMALQKHETQRMIKTGHIVNELLTLASLYFGSNFLA